jgi:hypothetical protein
MVMTTILVMCVMSVRVPRPPGGTSLCRCPGEADELRFAHFYADMLVHRVYAAWLLPRPSCRVLSLRSVPFRGIQLDRILSSPAGRAEVLAKS